MKPKIGRTQYFFLIPNLLYGKAIGITSGIVVRSIGCDAWTSMLMGFVIGTLVVAALVYLNTKFPDKTIIEYSGDLLGRWVGKVVGLILGLFFLLAFAISADVMVLHLKEYFLPQTPLLVICILYMALCMCGVYMGFEVVVRFSLIGFLMLTLLNFVMVLGVFKDFKFINLLPIFDKGIATSLMNADSIFGDLAMGILAIGVIYPTLKSKKKTVSLSVWSMVAAAVLILTWPIMETGVMGCDVMKQYVVVCMEQIRCVQLTKYLPRSELVMMILFIFSIYVQASAMLHCAKYSFKQIIGVKNDWLLLIPITIASIWVAYGFSKFDNKYINFLSGPWSQICTVLGIGLPMLLLIVALLRGKLKKSAAPDS